MLQVSDCLTRDWVRDERQIKDQVIVGVQPFIFLGNEVSADFPPSLKRCDVQILGSIVNPLWVHDPERCSSWEDNLASGDSDMMGSAKPAYNHRVVVILVMGFYVLFGAAHFAGEWAYFVSANVAANLRPCVVFAAIFRAWWVASLPFSHVLSVALAAVATVWADLIRTIRTNHKPQYNVPHGTSKTIFQAPYVVTIAEVERVNG